MLEPAQGLKQPFRQAMVLAVNNVGPFGCTSDEVKSEIHSGLGSIFGDRKPETG